MVDQYAVFGNPINHSKSPLLHASFARRCGQTISYRAILAPVDGFSPALQSFIDQGGRGANVTVPFKLEAFALCDEVTPRANTAAAVNTLWFKGGKIFGDNTDGVGLVRDITFNAGVTLFSRRVLLLGAGGAARGALLPLLEQEPSELVIANRSMDKAQQLAMAFRQYGPVSSCAFADLSGQFDVIINATSASLQAERPPLADAIYQVGSFAYDMLYADRPTLFLQHAASCQAQTRDGWGMLVEQAAEAFHTWRGVRPETGLLLNRQNLGNA